jgi:hypothetical protein
MDNWRAVEAELGTTASQPTDNPNAKGQNHQVPARKAETTIVSVPIIISAFCPVNGRNHTTEHRIRVTDPVHDRQQTLGRIMLDEGRGLAFVEVETGVDGLGGVVVALHDVAAAVVAQPRLGFSSGRREILLAVTTESAGRKALKHHLAWDIKVDSQIEGPLDGDRAQGFGLRYRSRKTIQQVATAARVWTLEPVIDDANHDVVANEPALVDDGFGLLAQFGTFLHVGTKNVAG